MAPVKRTLAQPEYHYFLVHITLSTSSKDLPDREDVLQEGWLALSLSQGLLDLYGAVDGSMVRVDVLSLDAKRQLAILRTWSSTADQLWHALSLATSLGGRKAVLRVLQNSSSLLSIRLPPADSGLEVPTR